LATRIRLKRYGAKHDPHYRIAIMDKRKPRDGRAVEEIGYYNPNTDPATVKIDRDRAEYWLSVGAQPSDTVRRLLAKDGIIEDASAGEVGSVETPPEAEDVAGEPVEATSEDAADEEEVEQPAAEENASEEAPNDD